jgi:hypothetical protein
MTNGDRDIVEEAEAHCEIAFRVMTWRSNDREAILQLAFGHLKLSKHFVNGNGSSPESRVPQVIRPQYAWLAEYSRR